MITNFEKHTVDLSEEELAYLPDVKRYLLSLLSGPAVKQNDLCDMINMKFVMEYGPESMHITAARLRKYFNYIRVNGLLPLIATSDGCYISNDQNEIMKQITSLKERARQIMRAAEGMEIFLSEAKTITINKTQHDNNLKTEAQPGSLFG